MVLYACYTRLSSNRSSHFIQILPGNGTRGSILQRILRGQHNLDKSRQRHYKKRNHKFMSLTNTAVEVVNSLVNQLQLCL